MKVRVIVLFLILEIWSCNGDKQELIFGDWSYERIEKNGESFIEVTETDILNLERDYLFAYHVDKANKHKQGSWSYDGDTLHLNYELEGVKRDFVVDVLTEREMRFYEGDMYFYFKRIAE